MFTLNQRVIAVAVFSLATINAHAESIAGKANVLINQLPQMWPIPMVML